MPGDPKERRLCGPGARPPSYVNVPSAVTYAAVPDALVVTMIRIIGLCWTNRYRRTPALSAEELARLLDRPRSTLYRHLELLEEELGWLRRERRGSRWVLHPLPPFAGPAPSGAHGAAAGVQAPDTSHSEARGAAVAVGDRDRGNNDARGTAVGMQAPDTSHSEARGAAVAVQDRDRGDAPEHGPLPGVAERDGGRSPREALAHRQDLIQALAEVGVENPARERIALDPRVKTDWIAAWQLWSEHPDRESLSNLPGYIVHCLRHRERPPDQYLRLVRLTSAEKSQLERSRWDGGPALDPDLHRLRPLYLLHFASRG